MVGIAVQQAGILKKLTSRYILPRPQAPPPMHVILKLTK